jgi:hypothetical protein
VSPFAEEGGTLGVRTFGTSTPIPRQHKLGPASYTPSAVVSGIGATVVQQMGGGPVRANPLINRAPLATSQLEMLQGRQIPRPQSIATSTSIIHPRPQSAQNASSCSAITTDQSNPGEEASSGELGVLHGRSLGSAHHSHSMEAGGEEQVSPKRSLLLRPAVTSTRVARPSTATDRPATGSKGGASALSTSLTSHSTKKMIPRPSSAMRAVNITM